MTLDLNFFATRTLVSFVCIIIIVVVLVKDTFLLLFYPPKHIHNRNKCPQTNHKSMMM